MQFWKIKPNPIPAASVAQAVMCWFVITLNCEEPWPDLLSTDQSISHTFLSRRSFEMSQK